MKKVLLYLMRWQLSTPILFVCVALLPFDDLSKTIAANLIGGLIFYKVDQWIFSRKKTVADVQK